MNELFDMVKKACFLFVNKDYEELFEINKIIERTIDETDFEMDDEQSDAFYNETISKYNENYSICIYVYSVWVILTKKEEVLIDFIRFVKAINLSYEEKYFLFKQIAAWMFWYPDSFGSCNLKLELTNLLTQIVEAVSSEIPDNLLEPIERKNTNNDLVVFITTQFLGEIHGPAKHAMDHAVSIMRKMNKRVLIINTAEGVSNHGLFLCKIFKPNYFESFNELDSVEWDGYKIPFFQCDRNMPNTDETIVLLKAIRELKPYMVVEVGSGSLISALVDKFLPVLTNGILHAAVEVSATYYQTIARTLTDEESEMLHLLGRDDDCMIYSMFSSRINRKNEVITRMDLKLDESDYVVAVVGSRLYLEIDDAFISMLCRIIDCNDKIHFIFFGIFDTYDSLMEPYSEYRKNIIYHGYTNNTLGCLEQCDLFLNPYRAGGGMSAIEAMVAGIPAVSMPYGDAGVVLGNEFWVDGMDEVPKQIIKYCNDKVYYEEQSKKSKRRGEYLQDSDTLFIDTLMEFERRTALGKNRV